MESAFCNAKVWDEPVCAATVALKVWLYVLPSPELVNTVNQPGFVAVHLVPPSVENCAVQGTVSVVLPFVL